MLATSARVLPSRCCASALPDRRLRRGARKSSFIPGSSPPEDSHRMNPRPGASAGAGTVSLAEWQGWGTSSPVPAMVAEIIDDMRLRERDLNAHMSFGGIGGKLKGSFRIEEDEKSRALYESLTDSEQKLQYYSSRQIACRLLGSRGYLCQKCWLPREDCMCFRVASQSLWCGIKFWIYMHPKDFLRQNNTGKLLWQLFGIQSACLCLFGIHEHEDIMWDALKHSGKNMVWFLYPNKSLSPKSVKDIFCDGSFSCSEDQTVFVANDANHPKDIIESWTLHMDNMEKPLNFVLIDGTWSNSAAMYRRLKEQWATLLGEEDLPCISLSSLGLSVMHKLRPQPAWDRTCTAAAAAGLLLELHHSCPQLSSQALDKQAEAVEDALDVLLDALTNRRLRMGRSITRKQRKMIST